MSPEEIMPESHRRQIENGRRISLRRAGIGEAWIDKTLADVACGKAISDWLTEKGRDAFITGNVAFVETAKPYARR